MRVCGSNGDRRGDARVACESNGSPRSRPIAGVDSLHIGLCAVQFSVREGIPLLAVDCWMENHLKLIQRGPMVGVN